jgi:sec-independent protein translocase protein TatB
MFGLSWSEILIIGVVALIFIGPNDLPRAMKTAAKWMSAGRKLAREFQGHIDDLVREAELEEFREKARQAAMTPLSSHLQSFVDPKGEIAQAFTAPDEVHSLHSDVMKSLADVPAETAATVPAIGKPTETAEATPAAPSAS